MVVRWDHLLGENIKKRIGSRTQSWVTPTLISWEEEENESDKKKKKENRKVGENSGEWGVPEAKKNFKKEGAVIGVRCSGDIKIRRSENWPLDLTQQSRAGEKSIDIEKEAGKPGALSKNYLLLETSCANGIWWPQVLRVAEGIWVALWTRRAGRRWRRGDSLLILSSF